MSNTYDDVSLSSFNLDNWTPAKDVRESVAIQLGLEELTSRQWATFRKDKGLEATNIRGQWHVRTIDPDRAPDSLLTDSGETVDGEVIDAPLAKLSVVRFGGLQIGSHASIGSIDMSRHRFDMSAMNADLAQFNEQLDAVDSLLDNATELLQEKSVEIELAVQAKRDRLNKLDEKLLATRTQAKILKDKAIVTAIESGELNREFVGKQDRMKDVVEEVRSLLD